MQSGKPRRCASIAGGYCLMRIDVPIGTIIGVIGRFAIIKARELFRPERIAHAEGKPAFKDLKSAKAFSRQFRRGGLCGRPKATGRWFGAERAPACPMATPDYH